MGEVPRAIIYIDPWCRAAFEGFGTRPDDCGVVATVDGSVVGACWARTTNEYGHIDDETPSFSISLYKPYRGKGMGTAMMRALLALLRDARPSGGHNRDAGLLQRPVALGRTEELKH